MSDVTGPFGREPEASRLLERGLYVEIDNSNRAFYDANGDDRISKVCILQLILPKIEYESVLT